MQAPTDPVSGLVRAAGLAERRATGPDGALVDLVAGQRALERWRRQEPFADPTWWQARLRTDAIDEADLRQLLGEPPDALAARLGPPRWADWLRRLAERTPTASAGSGAADGVPGDRDGPLDGPCFLAPAAGPLLGEAWQRLRTDLQQLVADGAPFHLDEMTAQLYRPLPAWLHTLLTRTLTLRLHQAKTRGELPDGTSEQRFAAFLRCLADPGFQRSLFSEYPVLARALTVAVDQWHRHSLQLARRLAGDVDLIGSTFGDGGLPGRVAEVVATGSDRHRGGQSVAVVRFESGLTVVYKPRPMAVDAAFAGLLRWLNSRSRHHPLRAPVVADRGDYGWMEHLRAEPCPDPAGVHRFYQRQGALLAVLTLLRANDIHAENLLAVGEQPVLVDLETLLQPELSQVDTRLAPAEQSVVTAVRRSVLQVGLLPTLGWRTADGGGVDLSGLGSRGGQTTAMALPVLADAGTDRMRVRREPVPLAATDHRPAGASDDLLDYADDLVAGFTAAHRVIRDHRDELLAEPDGPLAAFRGARVRVLLRPTLTYGTVLRTSFHPDVLADGLERERHLDHLWREVPHRPELAACVPAERRDLGRGDIPMFTAAADGDTLLDSDDRPVRGQLAPGLTLARRAVADWDERHLGGQVRLLRGTLATAAMNASDQLPPPRYQLPPDPPPATDAQLLAAAERVGRRLTEIATRRDGTAQWLGLNSQGGRHWTVAPLGPDLFNGLSGVAVFLAQLADMTGERRYRDLARDTLATVHAQLARQEAVATGGMAGLPGVAWAMCRLARLLDDEALIDIAAGIASGLAAPARQDRHFDVVAGSAGTIGSLRLLHQERPDGPALAVIAEAARSLADGSEPQHVGVGWRPAALREQGWATEPPAGFGHGAAGIAWALAQAAVLLGEPDYAQLASAALDYQRNLFDPDRGTWRDVRTTVDDPYRICAWCHGAVGIGLAALASEPVAGARDELPAALRATRRDGFGTSHSLCHGDAGALELLQAAAARFGCEAVRTEARQRVGAVLASIEADGWQCGTPYGTETPGLMVGLAGIGYELLRLTDPARVPSVLTLDAGVLAGTPIEVAATGGVDG